MSLIRHVGFLLCVFVACEVGAEDTKQLSDLTTDQAKKLITEYRSKTLSLDGLKTLTPEIASVLALHEGARERDSGWAQLSLNGLTRLSSESAEALAKYQGILHLQSLATLDSEPLVKKLASQQGELYLDGLLTLSPEFAVILAGNSGTRDIQLRADAIIHRGDRAASVLRFTHLPELNLAAASGLSKHDGILVLNGLTILPPDIAAELAKHKGTLVLNGLKTLSVESAAALSSSSGEIALKGLSKLSPEVAEALSKHTQKIYLDGSTEISEAALRVIRKHPKARLADRYRNN